MTTKTAQLVERVAKNEQMQLLSDLMDTFSAVAESRRNNLGRYDYAAIHQEFVNHMVTKMQELTAE